MIKINNKSECCGCSACVQACPKQCIRMLTDEEGFWYPYVDMDMCIDCHLCEKVCPELNIHLNNSLPLVFAAVSDDDYIRMSSSSGGVFTRLAETIINCGGVVFGACWDKDWTVHHTYATTIDSLDLMRGSKYMQSVIGDSFFQVKAFLREGRKVLFSGTPCQIAGLKLYLKKEYENLFTVECVCQSVPSPGVWKKYLSERIKLSGHSVSDIQSVNFRNKESGWKGYSFSIDFKDGTRYLKYKEIETWMLGFRDGLITRPSCTRCPSKSTNSMADLSLGDLWGITEIAPDLDDDKGITTVLIRTNKGYELLNASKVMLQRKLDFNIVAKKNLAITTATDKQKGRDTFWYNINNGRSIIETITRMTRDPLKIRLRKTLSRIYRTFIPRK